VVHAPAPVKSVEKEVLVVVSKVKKYIIDRSEMNTSDRIMPILSDKIRLLCDGAIDSARQEGRKTVLERDFEPKGE
jgi:histone H3/H4